MKRLFNANGVEIPQEVEGDSRPSDSEVGDNAESHHEKGIQTVEKPVDSDSDVIDHNLQFGVQGAKAVNQVWTKNQLIAVYALIWLVVFMEAFCYGVTSTLTPYVYSAFEMHSLTALTGVISSLIAGLFKFPYAKIIDIWGRAQGFLVMIGFLTLGLVMMAACKNVQTYCAAQVFYWVGYYGIDFSITIFIADTSALKNRAFWIGYASSPYLITTWVTGPAAQTILAADGIGFRWGFGVFCIIMPIVLSPIAIVFYLNQKKAEKLGLIRRPSSGRTFTESVVYYGKEFDVIGLLILATGLALFLLAFSLYSYQPDTWRSPLIICFLIFGGLLIASFVVWERLFAPVQFMRWDLIKNRTVFTTYTMAASLYMAWYIWDSYFYSLLIVVFDCTVTHATYISNIYTMGATFWSILMGVIVRYNGRLKWWALYFGVPLTILAVGLMIKFREPDSNIGYIIMCQIFIAFGGGTLVICEQMTVMAVSKQEDIPAVIAMEGAIISIGSSIGSTIAGAMWTGIFPQKLQQLLPASAQSSFADIYGSLTTQTSYPKGSPTRTAIDRAYGDTQRLMLITATSLYSITLASVLFWKNINVKDIKQISGLHF